ncbi:YdeI family protein [Bernardetia sp. OM2101]|uniref:YdeI/OmpD-associated family protein n=1 Tax=Bernardetia sp. OM2101 TaxID=3344876 RepID=UPI0035D118A9
MKEIETYYPQSKQQWREWLVTNHIQKDAVWLIFYKKKTGKPTLTWSDAVDEALCFGWIDSVKKTLDEERYIQYFSKRKPKSTWSKVNKEKVEQLIAKGLMMQTGLDCIKIAKQNGSWEILDSVEALLIPKDLEAALQSNENAMDFFMSLSKSVRKTMLYWVISAKRQDTRQKRITQIAELASKGLKPKQF